MYSVTVSMVDGKEFFYSKISETRHRDGFLELIRKNSHEVVVSPLTRININSIMLYTVSEEEQESFLPYDPANTSKTVSDLN